MATPTPLFNAAHVGDRATLQQLLATSNATTTINAKFGQQSRTALHVAIDCGHTECALDLIEAGADVNSTMAFNLTPLMTAAFYVNSEVATRLVQAGANVDATADFGATALTLAALNGCLPIVKLLVDARADVSLGEAHDAAPLLAAARAGHTECIRLLLDAGAKLSTKTSGGDTALSIAATEGHKPCVELLLQRGATVDARNNIGQTAVHKAAQAGHHACLKLLASAGANMAQRDNRGRTALHFAAGGGHDQCASLLLQAGLRVNRPNPWLQERDLALVLLLLLMCVATVIRALGGIHRYHAAFMVLCNVVACAAAVGMVVTNRLHLSPLEVAVQERRPQVARLLAAAAKQFSVKPEVCRPRAATSSWEAKREARLPATMKAVQGESRWRRRRGLALLREQRVAARDARNARLVHKHVVVE